MIDTHKMIKNLTVAGCNETLAEAITQNQLSAYDSLATKADIASLRVETKADFKMLESNIKMLESNINNIKWTVPIIVSIISLCGIYLPKLLAKFGM